MTLFLFFLARSYGVEGAVIVIGRGAATGKNTVVQVAIKVLELLQARATQGRAPHAVIAGKLYLA